MDDIEFIPNPQLEKDLHTFKPVTESTEKAANVIAAAARELAPVDTGAYRDSITVDKPSQKNGVARVVATDQKSSWIEFGNHHTNQPPQYVLRTAVEMTGHKFKKGK